MDFLEQIIVEIVDAYKKMNCCRAIALIGSRARGTAKILSDIDLMMICFNEPDKDERREFIRTLADRGKRSVSRDHPAATDMFVKGGHTIKIWYVPQDLVCERVATIDKLRRLDQTMLVASLFECRILWDPRKQLTAWKNRIAPVPEKYQLAVVPQIFGEIISVVDDLGKRQNPKIYFYFQHELIEAVKDIYELLFLLNGKYLNFTARIDGAFRTDSDVPGVLFKKIDELLVAPGDSKGLRRKWRLLAEAAEILGKYIVKKGKYNIRRHWSQLMLSAPFLKKPLEKEKTGKIKF